MTNTGSISRRARGCTVVVALLALFAGACSNGGAEQLVLDEAPSSKHTPAQHQKKHEAREKKEQAEPVAQAAPATRKVDPRKGGFKIGLGEWAITAEAPAIRPGRVTFVVHNGGTMAHGFEIELEGDSSGSGSGDLFKAESELLQPGETTRLTLDLQLSGLYKIECLVDGHDDMGMEDFLDVREDAPLMKVRTAPAGESGDEVSISNFAFGLSTLTVNAGTEVTWVNDDPAPHTVTAAGGSFDSDILDPDKSFSFVFEEPGTYEYQCNVHPEMTGTVKVE